MKVEIITEKCYTLTLNEEQARTLLIVLFNVGGDPDNTRRKYIDDICKMYRDADVRWNDCFFSSEVAGSIKFVPKP